MSQSKLRENREKVSDTPWTNLGIKLDLCSFLTRKVLVEKFSPQKSKEIEMRNFFISKIDGCEIYLNSKHPDSVFYVKNKEILVEKYEKNKAFYIKYTDFWSVFESRYMLQHNEIQSFTQITLEEGLKYNGYKLKITHFLLKIKFQIFFRRKPNILLFHLDKLWLA